MRKISDSLLSTTTLYPFRFEPVYKNYLWGGSRFQELFHRPISQNIEPVAESWEICDHPHGISIIQNGPLHGFSLRDVLLAQPQALFGTDLFPQNILTSSVPPRRFPLILKYLDASQTLSVQVHPDDRLAKELALNDLGKTEAWVIVDAKPKSSILIGTRQEYSLAEQEQLIRHNDWETLLNRVKVKVGDCFFVPPGTLHALGEGVIVAEIQTTSDLTFRMFDWNRLGKDGKPRELKVEEGIRALRNPGIPVAVQFPQKTEDQQYERLVTDDHFIMNRWTLTEPTPWQNDHRCHLLTILEGTIDLFFTIEQQTIANSFERKINPESMETLHWGDSILIPSVCHDLRWLPENQQKAVLLDIVPMRIS